MTEAEWLACSEPRPMLEFLRGKASERKLRLFAVACCRRIWHLLTDERSRKAVEVEERKAEGQITETELAEIIYDADAPHDAPYFLSSNAWFAATACSSDAAWDAAKRESDPLVAGDIQHDAQAALLRCIFGNPFRSIALDPAWMTGTVSALAQAIHNDRAFDRLPILADALEDAGCTNADILSHCRQPGEHCRGCWIVDLLLAKE
jgi:hypothetical protein